MAWLIEKTDAFDAWFAGLDDDDQSNVRASIILLEIEGPQLARPYADTVKASRHSNMKELRTQSAGKPIRTFFAFDPRRTAILLIGGDKTGDKRFYDRMISIADDLFDLHLEELKQKDD